VTDASAANVSLASVLVEVQADLAASVEALSDLLRVTGRPTVK